MKKFPKIIAHRGMPHLARENTLLSFHKAIETGAETIITDYSDLAIEIREEYWRE